MSWLCGILIAFFVIRFFFRPDNTYAEDAELEIDNEEEFGPEQDGPGLHQLQRFRERIRGRC